MSWWIWEWQAALSEEGKAQILLLGDSAVKLLRRSCCCAEACARRNCVGVGGEVDIHTCCGGMGFNEDFSSESGACSFVCGVICSETNFFPGCWGLFS